MVVTYCENGDTVVFFILNKEVILFTFWYSFVKYLSFNIDPSPVHLWIIFSKVPASLCGISYLLLQKQSSSTLFLQKFHFLWYPFILLNDVAYMPFHIFTHFDFWKLQRKCISISKFLSFSALIKVISIFLILPIPRSIKK